VAGTPLRGFACPTHLRLDVAADFEKAGAGLTAVET
jgi:hypothetical protein